MSFQAYLDAVEDKTGKTPAELVAIARERGIETHAAILAWLKADYGLGAGHGAAMSHVIRKGDKIVVRQTTGPHRDASDTLILTGKKNRAA